METGGGASLKWKGQSPFGSATGIEFRHHSVQKVRLISVTKRVVCLGLILLNFGCLIAVRIRIRMVGLLTIPRRTFPRGSVQRCSVPRRTFQRRRRRYAPGGGAETFGAFRIRFGWLTGILCCKFNKLYDSFAPANGRLFELLIIRSVE